MVKRGFLSKLSGFLFNRRGMVIEIRDMVIALIILAVLVWIISIFISGKGVEMWNAFKQVMHFGTTA